MCRSDFIDLSVIIMYGMVQHDILFVFNRHWMTWNQTFQPNTHTHWQQLHQKLMNHAYFFSMLLLLLFIPLFRSHNIEIEFFFNVLYAKRNYLQKKFQYPYFVVAFYSEFVDKPIDIKWAINSVGMIINNTNE